MDSIESGFISIPDSIQTSVYWYWVSDNLSKEGVIKDLEAMKKVGINRAFIGNIGMPDVPAGKVKMFTDAWWDILHTALKTATRLNIEIGIFNSPGWSQSGGPWIKPTEAMRYLASTDTLVRGPLLLKTKLSTPGAGFQDVNIIAFKSPKHYGTDLAALQPKIKTSVPVRNIQQLMDGHQNTQVMLRDCSIDFETGTAYTVRSLTIYPAHKAVTAEVLLQVKENNVYKTIKTFNIDRSNINLNVGFQPYGPVAVTVPATTAKSFRIQFKNTSADFGVAELKLAAQPVVESFTEKTLAKMYPTPLPYWKEYQWPVQSVTDDQSLLIDPKTVIDISKHLSADGTLQWAVPAGDWVIMRNGMMLTGVTNQPAPAEGTGLEVDKMSKTHIASHFNAFMGEILKRIPAEDRKTWKVVVEDSYETGSQNWTDDMFAKFKASYGYDPLPYLPVISGKVVGSQDQSDRFLWDLRRLIADRVAHDYVAGLRAISNKHGLRTWLENYGHWGFPGEFLQYGGQSDEIGGEFWSEGELGDIENRAASSSAHIYGKNKVSAESFTAAGKTFARYPAMMKQRGDRFFAEGINNTLLHVYIHQPDERQPGVNAWFGNEFNRHNTWFNQMDLFVAYLKRCNFLLQQGKYQADVAYFIGEDAPKMTGITDPALPAGYSFDYINAEVLNERATVKDGRITLPDGMNYGLLVLPKLETMRPELLKKLLELVRQGANILGHAPLRSPSLQGYPNADGRIRELVASLWDEVNGSTVKSRRVGKGMVMAGMDMQTALNTLNIRPDFDAGGKQPVLYLHRRLADGEIYFVTNQSEKEIDFLPSFKITGKQPELWDPMGGSKRELPEFSQAGGTTSLPLKLAPLQSVFLIFRNNISKTLPGRNFPEARTLNTISNNWVVTFDPQLSGPKAPVNFPVLIDWTLHKEEAIRYYSGTAVYSNHFNLDKVQSSERVYLNLGDVKAMAKVKINGQDVGGVWTAPWRVDITAAIVQGKNTVEISVVNTWANRIIGDQKLPAAARKTWLSFNPYKADSPLEPSGLTGPVTISTIDYGQQ